VINFADTKTQFYFYFSSSSFKIHVSYRFSSLNYLITMHNTTMTLAKTDEIPNVQTVETAPIRIPLQLDIKEEPIYVNSKQYHAILRRRQYRAKLEVQNKPIKDRKVTSVSTFSLFNLCQTKLNNTVFMLSCSLIFTSPAIYMH